MLRETEQRVLNRSESYELTLGTRNELIFRIKMECVARMKEGSVVAILQVEIFRLHREQKVPTGSVAKSEGVAARAQEQLTKLDAEDVRLREEAD